MFDSSILNKLWAIIHTGYTNRDAGNGICGSVFRLPYKPTIFGWILTMKLWGSAYMRVMPHGHTLSVRVSTAWTMYSSCLKHCRLAACFQFAVLLLTLTYLCKWLTLVDSTHTWLFLLGLACYIHKVAKRMCCINYLVRLGVPTCDILCVYCSLIRSVLEYACAVWHPRLTNKLFQDIERAQKHCLKLL